MKLQKKLLMAFEVGIVCTLSSGCGVPRPDTDLCVVNAEAGHQTCFNLLKDYDSKGQFKPGTKPHFKPAATVADLNKNICTDPDGWANLKIYIKQLRGAARR